MTDIENAQPQITDFERIKHIDEQGQEYWNARELMPVLTYGKWQDFHKVIRVAMEVYQNSRGNADTIFQAVRQDSPTVAPNPRETILTWRLKWSQHVIVF